MTGSGLEFKIDLMIRPNEGSVESAFQGLASGMCRRTRILVVSLASLFTTTFLNFFFGKSLTKMASGKSWRTVA